MTKQKRKCPTCGKAIDPRGYSGHVEHCQPANVPDIEEEEDEQAEKYEDTEETEEQSRTDSENMENVTPGKEVQTDAQTCDECGAFLYGAVEYRENIAYTLAEADLSDEEVQFYKHLNEQLKQYYAYCPACGMAYEKTEL